MSGLVSIIVVSYNTRDLLRDCLAAAVQESRARATEIWVVDNASTDGSAEMVQAEFSQVHLICNRENLGFAKANNQVLRRAQGDFLLLLNADAVLLAGSLEAMLNAFVEYPQVGICGPCLINPDGSLQPSWGQFPTPWTEFLFQSFLFKVWPGPFPYGRKIHPFLRSTYCRFRLVDWATGACLMLRQEVLKRVGLLPEGSFMYGEDLEYCFRARRAGFEVALVSQARVLHYLQSAARKDYQKWIENYTLAILRYHARHGTASDLKWVSQTILWGSRLRWMMWRVIGFLSPRRRSEAYARCRGYLHATALATDRPWR
jgi:GT2 family glycosyltransferase